MCSEFIYCSLKLIIAGIAIFCMLLTYYMWIKAVKTGTIFWSTLAALAYFYMVGILKKPQQLFTSTFSHPLWAFVMLNYFILIQLPCMEES